MANEYSIPPRVIDPQTLPPPLLTSEPGSFAHRTLAVRVPRIIEDTLAQNHFPDAVVRAVQELRAEILNGRIRALEENAPDRRFWNTASRDYIGRSWLDVPWYWAEAFFYRRMLEATRYFQPGPTFHLDPYQATKRTELAPEVAPAKVASILHDLPAGTRERFEVLSHASLWGNRVDLSYNVSLLFGHTVAHHDESANLLVDDTDRVWRSLAREALSHLVLIQDNAGTESLMDLVLIDFLLREKLVQKISLHLKPQPFFVSDAMPQDVAEGLAALARGGDEARTLAERVRHYLSEGRLELVTHWFYVTSLFYFQMPADLIQALRAANLVIVKGDANYRRLLGDAHWEPDRSFDYVTRYFPAPLVALRTFKSEVICGLLPGEAERLSRIDPNWLVNGQRGVIQARL